MKFSGKKNPTVRDFVEVSGRGTIDEHKVFCRYAEIGGRSDGGMVHRPCLRRFRSGCDAHAGML